MLHCSLLQSLIHIFIPPSMIIEGRHTLLDTLHVPHKTKPSVPCKSLYVKSFVWHTVGAHCPAQHISFVSQPCLFCPDGTEWLWFSVLEEHLPKYLRHNIFSSYAIVSYLFHWHNVVVIKVGAIHVFRPYHVHRNGIYWLIVLITLFWL